MRNTWTWTGLTLFAVAVALPSFALAQSASRRAAQSADGRGVHTADRRETQTASRRPAPVAVAMQQTARQQKPKADPKADPLPDPLPDSQADELVIKVYRVSDLIAVAPNYPYEGTFIPGMSRSLPGANNASAPGGIMGGMGGGMGGGMMGGMGGGMGGMGGGMMGATGAGTVRADHLAQVAPAGPAQPQGGGMGGGTRAPVAPRSPSPRITFSALVNTITSVINADSWEENGGDGSIQPIGASMAVSNTAPVHEKISKFLEALRSENDALRTISIDAHWLSLDREQLAKLRGPSTRKIGGAGVSREAMDGLPEEARRASAQITCLNGQTVHVISGLMRTKIQGSIPSVGGDAVGYQPIVNSPHLGALLQTTTSLLPGEESALIDLQSLITRWDEESEAVRFGNGNAGSDPVSQVDRLNVGAQQLATSLRAPLGKPILVGGLANPLPLPTAGAPDAVDRLYLVIEITAPTEK